MGNRGSLPVILGVGLMVLPLLPAPGARAEVVGRASVASDGTQANGPSQTAVVSADGRFVAFGSTATNLVPGDTNGVGDVFVLDRQTGLTARVSVASSGAEGNGLSSPVAITADGRLVLFLSDATNLVPGDSNGASDILLHDRATGVTSRASLGVGSVQANADSCCGAMSADGRFVAFASTATNLVPGDTNKTFDVFVRDRVLGTTERVSVATSGAQAVGGPSGSSHPAISANGRFVAFDSDATNLVPGDTNGVRDVFVHDRLTGTTTRVSRPTPSGQANGSSHGPAISASGQFVAFYSFATNLVTGDTNGEGDVFLHNRAAAGTTVRVSVATGGAEAIGGGSFSPVVSAEGRYIVFQSLATNLVPDDFNGVGDYFVRDRLAGTTSRLSIAPDGTEGDAGGGLHRAISADGRIAVFASDATTLVDSDTNGATDVFVARVPVGPNWLVVGQGAGGDPGLRGFDADGGATFLDRLAFAGGFTGGVRVATADLDGDGMPEIITARGPGSLPQVRVFRGSSAGSVKATFLAYPASFTGGAYVAAGDVDGDGIPEIVTAAGAGSAGPLVRIYKLGPPVPILGTPVTLATLFTEFFVYDPAFTGGISVAVGDVTGDGIAEVITGGGPGAGSHVRIHQIGPAGAVTELLSFYVDSPVFPGGVTVAAGDVDGDGKAELIVGLGPGGLPRVWVYGVDPVFIFGQFAGYVASLVAELDAYDPLFGGGINVGAGDTDGDGRANVITGAGPGGGPHVRTFAVDGGTLVPQLSFFAYDPAFTGGVFPAGLP